MLSFREQQGEKRKLSEIKSTNKWRKTTEWERIQISLRRLEISRENIHTRMDMIKDRNGKELTKAEDIKMRWQESIELYAPSRPSKRKVLMTWITMMVWSLVYSQTSWSVKSHGPQKALLQIKLLGGDRLPAELFQILKDEAVKALHSITNLESSAMATGLGKVNYHSSPKEGQCQ